MQKEYVENFYKTYFLISKRKLIVSDGEDRILKKLASYKDKRCW